MHCKTCTCPVQTEPKQASDPCDRQHKHGPHVWADDLSLMWCEGL